MPEYHIVKKEEYVGKIAEEHNVFDADIILWNGLQEPDYIIKVGDRLIVSDPTLDDPDCTNLEHDICGKDLDAEQDFQGVTTNGSNSNVGECCETCQNNVCEPPPVDCIYNHFTLEKEIKDKPNRKYIQTQSTSRHDFQITAGYGSNPSKVKLKVDGVKTVNCTSSHENNVILAKVEKEHQASSDTEYEYPIVFSYGLQDLIIPVFPLPFYKKLQHEWSIETCGKSEKINIRVFPDDKLTLIFKATPFKRSGSKETQKMVKKKTVLVDNVVYETDEHGNRIPKIEQTEKEEIEFTGDPETILTKAKNKEFLFYAKLEYDGGSEIKEYQIEKVGKKGFKTTKNPIDPSGKWGEYKKKIDDFKDAGKNLLAFKEVVNNLFNSKLLKPGYTLKVSWDIFFSIGVKGIFNIEEIPQRNYCGFKGEVGIFVSAGASFSVDFANQILALVPVIGPGLVALNVGLSSADMGGLVMQITFSGGIEEAYGSVNFSKSFETNQWDWGDLSGDKTVAGRIEGYIKIKMELGIGVEYKTQKDLWVVSIEIVAEVKGQVWGESGIYATIENPSDPNDNPDKEYLVDIGYLPCEVVTLVAFKLGAEVSANGDANEVAVDGIDPDPETTTEETESDSLGGDGGYSKKWEPLWGKGSFGGFPKKLKEMFN